MDLVVGGLINDVDVYGLEGLFPRGFGYENLWLFDLDFCHPNSAV